MNPTKGSLSPSPSPSSSPPSSPPSSPLSSPSFEPVKSKLCFNLESDTSEKSEKRQKKESKDLGNKDDWGSIAKKVGAMFVFVCAGFFLVHWKGGALRDKVVSLLSRAGG